MNDQIQFVPVSTRAEVAQILDLQAQNLASVLSAETMASQGFLTVRHDPGVLQRMNEKTPAIIAKAGDRVVGYALVMPRDFAAEVPVLLPMFDMLDQLSWKGVALRNNPRWFVMGQICVAEGYRGLGIFDGMYLKMKEVYRPEYDFTVTEVAERNTRSMRAHERVGFQGLHTYPDKTTGNVWRVVVLEF
ncbi:MAG: GNAT family N-acetyltransferase [Lewinellaceae bacterium]|nr:GNAT family N-acetyltransferase [Lewinellaceae bacterium]